VDSRSAHLRLPSYTTCGYSIPMVLSRQTREGWYGWEFLDTTLHQHSVVVNAWHAVSCRGNVLDPELLSAAFVGSEVTA